MQNMGPQETTRTSTIQVIKQMYKENNDVHPRSLKQAC